MKSWLVKSEPEAYSFAQLQKDKTTAWTGVRNYTARINLRAMAKGDEVFFYHSVTDPSVVGIAKVSREAYPDPTAKEGDWSCVDLVPVRPLSKSVTLAYIKSHPALSEIALIRQSRLSVMPISPKEYAQITGASGSNK